MSAKCNDDGGNGASDFSAELRPRSRRGVTLSSFHLNTRPDIGRSTPPICYCWLIVSAMVDLIALNKHSEYTHKRSKYTRWAQCILK